MEPSIGVVQDLVEALGEDQVRVGDRIDVRYHTDWSKHRPASPRAVVLPRSTEDVAVAIRCCHRHNVGVVPQGGLTGLAGGATPTAECVAINLERMRMVGSLDAAAETLTVEAGVTLEQAQRAADEAGFELAVDLGSRGSCHIGGMVATNAGGNRVLRFGMMREQVLGLEVVLADGSIVSSMHPMLKNNTGYDVKQLFVGSEGTLGIITKVLLRLHPAPAHRGVALVAMPSPDDIPSLLGATRRTVANLTSFEVMWPFLYRHVTERHARGAPIDAEGVGAFALIEATTGSADESDDVLSALLAKGIDAGVIIDGVVARSSAEAQWFWDIREAHVIDQLPRIVNFDVGLPLASVARFVAECTAAVERRWPGAHQFFYGHLGDSNLHISTSLGDVADAELEALDDVVYGLVRAAHGSISAEHGIGTLKHKYLSYSRSPAELAVMRAVKSALDPTGIMNPGKVL